MKKKYICPTIDFYKYDLTLCVIDASVETGTPDEWSDARRRGVMDDDNNGRDKTFGSRGSRGKGWGSLW